MKNKMIPIALMVILFLSAALTVMAICESTEQLHGPEVLTFSVDDLNLDTDELNEYSIQNVLANAGTALTGKEQVYISDNPYTREFIRVNPDVFGSTPDIDNEQLLLPANTYDVNSKEMQYLVFLSYITEEYADCIIQADINYDFSTTTNRNYFYGFFICPSFRTSGYETIEDYYRAILGGECDAPEDAYKVYYHAPAIWRYDTSERLELFPDDNTVTS